MTDKYSHKPTKKKKSQARKAVVAQETIRYDQVVPAAAPAAPTTIPAATVRPERPTAAAPDLTVELKRVGILGGILLVVLVATSFLFS